MARKFVPSQHQFLKYILFYKGRQYEIDPPDNWQQAQKEIARSKQYHGMMVTLSDQVEFSGYSSKLIRGFYDDDGVVANVTLVEYELNNDDEWELIFSGTLDYSQYEINDLKISLKINSQALEKKMTSRYQTEVTLDSDTDLDGVSHGRGATPRITIDMKNRNIEGGALLSVGETGYVSSDANKIDTLCVMLTSRKVSYNGDIPRTYTVAQRLLNAGNASVDNLIYYQQQNYVDRDGQPQTFDLSLAIDFEATFPIPLTSGTGSTFTLIISKYKVIFGSDDTPVVLPVSGEQRTLVTKTFTQGITDVVRYTGTQVFNMEKNDGIIIYIQQDFGTLLDGWEYTINSCTVDITGPIQGLKSTNDAILPYDFFKRMIQQIGGENLDSNLLSQSRLALCDGYMIRNVLDQDGNKPPVSLTFEKLYSSFGSVEPLGLSVRGNTVKIEKREYFYQDFISKDFGSDITNVKYSFDKEHAFSEISVGFETSNFSREGALEEFNVRTVWVSPINTFKKELNLVSNIQGSHNTIEKLRQVQYQRAVERTYTRQGDSTMYFIDLKDDKNQPRERLDDFSAISGIPYSSSAYNLRLSPMNRLRKQGKWINFAYDKFDEKFLTFASSTGATGMITQPYGEVPRGEDQGIRISDMDAGKYRAEKVQFEIPPQNLFLELNETINDVSKSYGLFRFTHNGNVIHGYLLSYQFESNTVELQIARVESITDDLIKDIPEIPTGITLTQI